MRRYAIRTTGAILAIAAVVAGISIATRSVAATGGLTPKIVEYKVVKNLDTDDPVALQTRLNELGKDGWEFVTIKMNAMSEVAIFKR